MHAPTTQGPPGVAAASAIDWSALKREPLRKQKQALDVRDVSDPQLASRIIEASERILRYLGLLLEATSEDGDDPFLRSLILPLVVSKSTVVRVPPREAGGRARFLHVRIHDWKLVGAHELEFRVLYSDLTGKRKYSDDFRFRRFNDVWWFAGHVSPQPTPVVTAP